jgi:hypothetical protein
VGEAVGVGAGLEDVASGGEPVDDGRPKPWVGKGLGPVGEALIEATHPPASWRLCAGLRISAVSLLIAAAACVIPINDPNAATPAAATLLIGLAVIALLNSISSVDLHQ